MYIDQFRGIKEVLNNYVIPIVFWFIIPLLFLSVSNYGVPMAIGWIIGMISTVKRK
jgi:hypothetical protein